MEVGAKRRVTVVAHELRGFVPVGGMGTATTFLTLALARMGHSVEILLGLDTPESIDPYWASVYKRRGVRIRRVPRSDEPVEPWYFVHTHSVQLGLQAEPADVIIAHDFGAPAYSALRLREAGAAFENTLFVIFCHGPRRYIMDLAPRPQIPDLRNLLAVTVQEQGAIELADLVVSPSAYLVDWMRSAGWRLPDRTFVIPYFTQSSATGEPMPKRAWPDDGERLKRLAFFGRLDERKGVTIFAAGLNALEPRLLEAVELEFVGKTTSTWPRERIQALLSEKTRRALRSVAFQVGLDQHDALARLSETGTLAVMPSLQENSPNAVYECLERAIPFIASNVGGVPELIAAEDHVRVLFEPTPEGVEAALRRVLSEDGALRPARPAFSADAPYERWADVIDMRPRPRPRFAGEAVDVIVVHGQARKAPSRCVAALEHQTYANFRVIVAEGASTRAARQAALRESSAPYVLFLDEDDVPEGELLDTLVRAQAASGADVVSCGLRLTTDECVRTLYFFSGEPGGLGALSNEYGNVALFRRELLGDLTTPWQPEADADWPLLAGLAASGARMVSVPLPLVTRRARPGSIDVDPSDALLAVEQLEHALPDPLRLLARLAGGLAANAPKPRDDRATGVLRRARQIRRDEGVSVVARRALRLLFRSSR